MKTHIFTSTDDPVLLNWINYVNKHIKRLSSVSPKSACEFAYNSGLLIGKALRDIERFGKTTVQIPESIEKDLLAPKTRLELIEN